MKYEFNEKISKDAFARRMREIGFANVSKSQNDDIEMVWNFLNMDSNKNTNQFEEVIKMFKSTACARV